MDPAWLLEILVMIFALSVAVKAARLWRSQALPPWWWFSVALLGFVLVALTRTYPSPIAPWLNGAYLLYFSLLPIFLRHRYTKAAFARDYARAIRYATWITRTQYAPTLHPRIAVLKAIQSLNDDQYERGHQQLKALEETSTPSAYDAKILRLSLELKWDTLLEWSSAPAQRARWHQDSRLPMAALRSLGELREEALFLQHAEALQPLLMTPNRDMFALFLFVYLGRPKETAQLFKGPFGNHGPDYQKYWYASALQRAGRADEAAALLRTIRTGWPIYAHAVADRLERPLPPCPPEAERLTPLIDQAFAEIQVAHSVRSVSVRPWLTYLLIALNVIAFVVTPPGPEYAERLYDAGALLLPVYSLERDGFRVISACFLHFGYTHLIINMLGLFYLGRLMESRLGRWRMTLSYLIAGPGAFFLFLFWPTPPGEVQLIVGASGAIMGLFGAYAADLIRTHALRTQVGRRILLFLGILFAIQTGVDFITPEISMGGHLLGAFLGFTTGLILSPGVPPRPPSAPSQTDPSQSTGIK